MSLPFARSLPARFSAVMLLAAVAALTPSASADEDEDAKPKRRRMIVTVEDSEDETIIVKKKRSADAVPEEGASQSEVNAYLRKLRKDVRDTQNALRDAKRADDANEALRLKDELREKKILLKEEEQRLNPRDRGLIAGGATLTALGSLSLATSLAFLIVYGASSLDGNAEEEYGWVSLATLGGGALGLSAGIPMIVAGSKRQVRDPEDEYEYAAPLMPGGNRPPVGMTFTVSF